MNTGRPLTGQLSTRALAAIFAVLVIGALLFAVTSSRRKQPAIQEAFGPDKPARATMPAAAPTRTPTPTQAAFAVVQPSATPQLNCTYVSGYWKDHPQAWMVENILIGRFSYTKKEAIAVLAAEPESLRSHVLKQFFTAVLNMAAGVDASAISDLLTQASAWFDTYSLNPELTPEETAQGEALVRALEEYNNGVTGPGACPGQTILPLTSFVETPTPTPTLPPTADPAFLQPPAAATGPSEKIPRPPKATPSAGGQPTPAPTQAPAPTPQPQPTQPPPPPTEPPQPTSAPPEPTNTPGPTREPRPTKEPKPTKPPK